LPSEHFFFNISFDDGLTTTRKEFSQWSDTRVGLRGHSRRSIIAARLNSRVGKLPLQNTG